MNNPCADYLFLIKYIRNRVANSKNIEEALEVIDEIIDTLKQDHVPEIVARIRIHTR